MREPYLAEEGKCLKLKSWKLCTLAVLRLIHIPPGRLDVETRGGEDDW